MQLHHDPSTDPTSVTSHERERQRIADATAEFLARGGEVQQLGHQMQTSSPTFVINPKTTPVFAHLFVKPQMEVAPAPVAAQPDASIELVPPAVENEPRQEVPVALLRAWAVLNKPPQEMAARLGISEKELRQLCRDHQIKITRQR